MDTKNIINKLLLFGYIVLPHYVMKSFWPILESFVPQSLIKGLLMGVVQLAVVLTCIAFYSFLYYFKPLFFEKYKVNNLTWPWDKDQEEWKRMRTKLIKVYFLNFSILGPIFTEVFYRTTNTQTTSESFPSLSVNKNKTCI